MPKVSVIIPCYNQGIYLDEAVDSVLNQTCQDFEVIIVNDGSTDASTNELLANYHRPKTRVLSTVNQGLPTARNTGIGESLGEYILPLDADDRIGPCYLEKAVAVLERDTDMGIVYCFGELFGARSGKICAPEFSIGKMLLSNLIFASAFFRKEDWQRVGGYNLNMRHGCEDWDFWLSLIELGRRVHRIPEVLFYYRIREQSMNVAMDREKRLEMHLRLMGNHPLLYMGSARPAFALYYRFSCSRLYGLLKKTRLLSLIQRILSRTSRNQKCKLKIF
jgi:glycosyltransferase involved in cell wall biosynthesis